MACDCDQLNNRLRDLESRLRRLEGNRSGNNRGGNQGNDNDLIERVFRDKRWLAAVDCLKVIIRGNA
jgi:hypothetical protein